MIWRRLKRGNKELMNLVNKLTHRNYSNNLKINLKTYLKVIMLILRIQPKSHSVTELKSNSMLLKSLSIKES